MKGIIFDIKKYAIHDGPNIRTTIFFKGCPLKCWWCHNPEGIDSAIDMVWKDDACIGCRECLQACTQEALQMHDTGIVRDKKKCSGCFDCLAVCPALAHEATGREVTVDDVMVEIKKDLPFYDQSKGGVTFSGGEPLMQPEFLLELLRKCGELGIHRAVDTCCVVKYENLQKIAEEAELFLVDLKHMDGEKHQLYTGVSNSLIFNNIKMLADIGKNMRFRIPLVEGVNSDDTNIINTGKFVKSLGIDTKIDLLPYHSIAAGKYKKLGLENRGVDFKPCSEETIRHCHKLLTEMGLKTQIGG